MMNWIKAIKAAHKIQDQMDFNQAASDGDIDAVRTYLNEGRVDPTNQNHLALKEAAYKGHNEVVGVLLRFADDPKVTTRALTLAAHAGHVQCVEQLIPHSNPKANCSEALFMAIGNGHHECVAALLPHSDNLDSALNFAAGNGKERCLEILIGVANPMANESQALRIAAERGRDACVAMLIPVSDPQADDNYAIAFAAQNGHLKCVELLAAPHAGREHQRHPCRHREWPHRRGRGHPGAPRTEAEGRHSS